MNEIAEILADAKSLAKKYRKLTGKPLGITGEVAEFSAAQILGLELAEVRQSGYDAIRKEDGTVTRIQIKGRCIADNSNPGQRLGRSQLNNVLGTNVEFVSGTRARYRSLRNAACAHCAGRLN